METVIVAAIWYSLITSEKATFESCQSQHDGFLLHVLHLKFKEGFCCVTLRTEKGGVDQFVLQLCKLFHFTYIHEMGDEQSNAWIALSSSSLSVNRWSNSEMNRSSVSICGADANGLVKSLSDSIWPSSLRCWDHTVGPITDTITSFLFREKWFQRLLLSFHFWRFS